MKIWYLSAYDQPFGNSRRTFDYCLELIKYGHEVTMFTNSYCHWRHVDTLKKGEKYRIDFIENIKVVWLNTFKYKGNGLSRGLNMLSNMKGIYKASKIIKDDPDIIIGPSVPIGTGFLGLLMAKKMNAKFIYEIRDVWPDALVSDGSMAKSSLVYKVFKFMEKKIYQHSDGISTTLPYVENHVKNNGASNPKISWLPNGVRFENEYEYDRFDGGNSESLTAMYIGGFGEAHDVITIVKAAVYLNENNEDNIKFIIIGSGPKKEACIQLATRNHLDNIIFLDAIPKSEVPAYLNTSDVLIASILDSEAYQFGLNLNKIFDYMASRRPVIFSGASPNNPIEESNSGFTIAPENPKEMSKILKHYADLPSKTRAEMGERGRQHVQENYSMSSLGLKMNSFLVEVFNRNNKVIGSTDILQQ